MLLIYAGVKFYGVDTLRYLTLFDVLKNTDFEFWNKVRGILPKIRERFVSTCNQNLLAII